MQEQGEDTGAVNLDDIFSNDPNLGDDAGQVEAGEIEQTGPTRDAQGRFAAKEPAEGDDGGEAVEAGGEERQDADGGHVPSWRLRELREERDAERQRFAAIEQELAQLRQERQQWQQRQQEEPQRPDLYGDPDNVFGYIERGQSSVKEEIRKEFQDMRIEETFAEMAEQHGERFEKAFQAVQRAPQQVHVAIRTAPNPGKALMRWYGNETAMEAIGGDLDGFLTKKQEEWLSDPKVREKIMQQMRDEAAGNSMNGRSTVTIPSVGRASGGRGGSSRVMDSGSPTDVFESIFPD